MSAGCNCGPNSPLARALGCHCVRRGILQSLPVSCHFRGCEVPLFRIVSGAISSELALPFYLLFIHKLWPTQLPTNIVTPNPLHTSLPAPMYIINMHIVYYLRAIGRRVLWSSACVSLCVCLCVCVSVCLCALSLSARYLENGFMDHHQIRWVGAGGEPLEEVQFWC